MAIASGGDLADIVRDDARFRDWYDATLPRVYRYLVARCGGDEGLAEELTQQTFIRAVRSLERFDGRSDVVTWLCAIGRNCLVDHHRRGGREASRQDRLIAAQEEGSAATWRTTELRDGVEDALRALSPDQRLALLFQHLDGLSVREIAAVLGRSEKATESLLSRARDGFRRAYGDRSDA